jgi:medium-chain acyl-[acyl-carrier-protein] hydrolase
MFQLAPTFEGQIARLFCIPHAGGGPSAYRGWREILAPDLDVVIIELPGREARFREAPYRKIDDLVSDLADAVLSKIEDGQPFAFFGNSLGGLVAFEALNRIRAQSGLEAEHLFVSAVGAPHMPIQMRPIAQLPDSDFIREIRARYAGIPAPVLEDADLFEAMLPMLRADIDVVESYRRQPPRPLACPITAFSGIRDKAVEVKDVEAWSEQTISSFTHIRLDEDHLYLQSARGYLTAQIRNTLFRQQRMV